MTEVYIASVAPLEDTSRFETLLSSVRPARRARTERIRRAEEQRRSLGAELLLRRVLLRYGIEEYSVSLGEHGKPRLDGVEGLFFNLSHAGEYVACAISDGEIGCDIERIDRGIDLGIADRFFLPEEAAWIRAAEVEEARVDRFFRLWTLKESVMKATGKGFSLSPRAFSLDLCGAEPLLCSSDATLSPYFPRELAPPDGYRLSVCTANGLSINSVPVIRIDL